MAEYTPAERLLAIIRDLHDILLTVTEADFHDLDWDTPAMKEDGRIYQIAKKIWMEGE